MGVMEINRGQIDLPEYHVEPRRERGRSSPRRAPAYSA
jgi:hypothetical protein